MNKSCGCNVCTKDFSPCPLFGCARVHKNLENLDKKIKPSIAPELGEGLLWYRFHDYSRKWRVYLGLTMQREARSNAQRRSR